MIYVVIEFDTSTVGAKGKERVFTAVKIAKVSFIHRPPLPVLLITAIEYRNDDVI